MMAVIGKIVGPGDEFKKLPGRFILYRDQYGENKPTSLSVDKYTSS